MGLFLSLAISFGVGSLIKIAFTLDRIADALEKKNESAAEAKSEDKGDGFGA